MGESLPATMRAYTARAWHWLTDPPDTVTEEHLRRQARLLLSLLVIFFFVLAIIAAIVPLEILAIADPNLRKSNSVTVIITLVAGVSVVLLAYALARNGKIKISAIIVIAMDVLVSFAAIASGTSAAYLSFPAIAIVSASVLLTHRETVIVWAASVVGMLVLGLLGRGESLWTIFTAITLVFVIGALSVTSAVLHDRDFEEIQSQARKIREDGEKLLEAKRIEAVARLSAGIAHELNNTVAGIVVYAEAIARNPSADSGRHAQLIKEAGFRAGNLTDKLLSFSRQQLLHPRAFDVNQLLESMEPSLRLLLEKGRNLTIRSRGTSARAYADPDAMEQVIQALVRKAEKNLRNAAKDSASAISIETGVSRQSTQQSDLDSAAFVTIAVADNGPPLPKEAIRQIFDPFFTEGEFGTGDLDLAAAYGLARQSGGNLEATSGTESGNTFLLLIPAEADNGGSAPAS